MPLYMLAGRSPVLPAGGRVWIAPDATVMGDVELGEDASVWFGAVVRGDTERIAVGARTNVQEHAVLHTDAGFPLTIGEGCTVGHRAILHGCTIGDGALIGMGAIVLNGARIGPRSLVGAGALVTEGKSFPENSLIVGAPAKAVRTLDADALARLEQSAQAYVERARRCAAELARIED